ncbi:MAG TPA: TonB-dependent receptor, partial [Chitinophagales bacterium]|nr:TonB-dependent receptor [Chitinophagales bacterium]
MKAARKKHELALNINAYVNKAKAEMTMYPKDTAEKPMFMYTWPDVQTIYAGANISDKYTINKLHSIRFSAAAGLHRNNVASAFGLNSLRIFYPELKAAKNRGIFSVQAGYGYAKKNWAFSAGIAFGERAPTVSEAYGFYLFNSADGYDYIGNPYLKNEKSLEINTTLTYKIPKVKWHLGLNYFHILDYIIGIPNTAFIPMTMGAKGIKEYH